MKILYVTTIGMTMTFFKSLIKDLIDNGHTVDIATNDYEHRVDECYRQWGCNVYTLSCSRSPLKKDNLKAVNEIKKIVKEEKYDIVHCHTPVAAGCTRLACRKIRKKGVKVIYTAHGFHFYNGAPIKNWLIFYPIEWLCSFLTDTLITINEEDFERAKKHMHAKRVEYVPGVGIDTQRFAGEVVDKSFKRKEIGVPEDAFLLLSVGELNENKNHQVVIRALKKLNNPNVHYAVAGKGELYDNLIELSKSLGVESQVHLLGFRDDIPQLYKTADADIFPSIREGLGLAALEGMAAGLPLICSDNRGTKCYATEKNSIVCSAFNSNAFADAIKTMVNDKSKCILMGKAGQETAKKFEADSVNKMMLKIYKTVTVGR